MLVDEFIILLPEQGLHDCFSKKNYAIIDSMMNIPLLYWASEETGDNKFRDVAQKHIHTTMNCIFREDYSTYHTYGLLLHLLHMITVLDLN